MGAAIAASLFYFLSPAKASQGPLGIRFEGQGFFGEVRLRRALVRYSVRIEAPLSITDADDAAFFLREFYRDHGFWEAKVDYRFHPSTGTADLIIDEGKEFFFGKMEFPEELALDEERLRDIAVAAIRRHSAFLFGRLRFSEAAVTEAASAIVRTFAALGYRAAKVDVEWRAGEIPDRMDVTFHINQGSLYVLRSVDFRGVPPDRLEEFQKLADTYVGGAFTPDEELLLRGRFLRELRNFGYYRAELTAELFTDSETGDVRILFDAHPGNRYRIGKIRVAGHERTFPAAIVSRLGLREGGVFNAGQMDAGVRRLWFTGAFKEASVEVDPGIDDVLDLNVQVEEGRARQIRGTLGYGEWQGFFGSISYGDRNFLGTLNRLNIQGNLSQKGYGGLVQLSDPWFLRTETTGTLTMFYQRQEMPAYRATFFGGIASLERQFDPANLTGHRFRYTWKAVLDTTIFADSEDVQDSDLNYTVGIVNWGQTLDRRNDMLSPMSGYFLRYDLGLASQFLGGDIEYFQPTVQATTYLPMRPITPERPFVPFFILNHRAGLIAPFGSTKSLPVPERMFLGGPDSVRSFQFDGMAPRAQDGSPSGGELYWLLNAELQVPVWNSFYVATFLDAGNLAPTIQEYSWDDTRIAAGLGLRFYTPIGAIRVDYGYNLIRGEGDPVGAFQFGFGFSF